MQKRTAQLIVEGLAAAGVTKIFTLSGNQIMPLFDACIDTGLELIHVRHEAAAGYMAEGWAQLSGELGVALLTAGPGFTNGLTPLLTARASETPLLLISGDAPLSQSGMGAFQELDQVAMTTPLTKLSLRADSAASVCADLARLIRTARSGRPGPVHLALPFDIVTQQPAPARPGSAADFAPVAEAPDAGLVDAVHEALVQARRPLLITGPALNRSRTGDLHARLSAALAAPVICMESPRGMADPALGDIGRVLRETDLVVTLGKAIDFTVQFGRTPTFDAGCRFVVIDAETTALTRAEQALGGRAAMLCRADALAVANALCVHDAGPADGRGEWLARVAEAIAARAPIPSQDAGEAIHPAALSRAVQRVLSAAPHPILVCDGGEFGQWAQACTSAPTRIINGVSGAIGGGLCYAIAAKLHQRDATVLALMGDGTIGFHLSEFDTALRYDAPIVAVVGHDACWNAEVQIQLRDYGAQRRFATDLRDTRYDLAVAGLGGHGEHVTDPGQLDAALRRALESGLPACVNVVIEGQAAPAGSGH